MIKQQYFCQKIQDQSFSSKQTSLSLLSEFTTFNIFDYIPRTFSVSTKNFTSNFNIDMLTEVSPVISEFLEENPSETHFFMNINDEENVLSKFEQLFQGETVFLMKMKFQHRSGLRKFCKSGTGQTI